MGLSFILYLLAVIFVLAGIAGIILPALPGIPLVFIGLLLAPGRTASSTSAGRPWLRWAY